MALGYHGQLAAAIPHLAEAVRLLPAGFDRRYNPVDMQCSLGNALLENGDPIKAEQVLSKALTLNSTNARTQYLLAMATAAQGKKEESLKYYGFVRNTRPALDTSAELHVLFASNYAKDGQMQQAVESLKRATQLARASGNAELVENLTRQLRDFEGDAALRARRH